MSNWLQSLWYRDAQPPAALHWLSPLYGAVASRIASKKKSQAQKLPVPVIVVGNLTVGGTGKTPFVVWLVEELRARGLRPGVVSRGYGGCAPEYPLRVTTATDAGHSGDEPALLARRLRVPLSVAPDRVAAAQQLLDSGLVDVLIADDGLQHYRLARDAEVCVVDGSRGLGNGALLPAGPLREPLQRLESVGLVIVNGGGWRPSAPIAAPIIDMHIKLGDAQSLATGERRPLAAFKSQPVHAVAGIGNPQRYFDALRRQGLEVLPHPFADHHDFEAIDFALQPELPVLMTEKDAVKCGGFAQPGLWFVPATACFEPADAARVREWLSSQLKL